MNKSLAASKKWRRLLAKFTKEDGSISILVIGLFMVVVLASVVLTDISAVIVAQRSLIQVTESAAQSAAHALDLSTYYQGKHSALSFLVTDSSPVVPLDCEAAKNRVQQSIGDLQEGDGSSIGGVFSSAIDRFSGGASGGVSGINRGSIGTRLRPEISEVAVIDFQCNGNEILITTSAVATLPISLSLFSFESVKLSATAGTTSIKKHAFSIFGINI